MDAQIEIKGTGREKSIFGAETKLIISVVVKKKHSDRYELIKVPSAAKAHKTALFQFCNTELFRALMST